MQSSVVLVTGSARGLGLACARHFAREGARVHVVLRTQTAQSAAVEREFSGRAHRGDATREEDLARIVESVVHRDGRLDIAVGAVGEFVSGPLSQLSPADFRRLFASNAESAFLLARAVLPALRSTRGQLVLFAASGLDGLRARREAAAYMAAKSALIVLARSLALEEAGFGVRVNVVSPGVIAHEHADADTFAKLAEGRVPLKGVDGEPRDVAEAVAWLCSPKARLITGANIEVAGGFGL